MARRFDDDIAPIASDAIAQGIIEELGASADERRTWRDCDLASFAENRIGVVEDPRTLSAARRAELEKTALADTLSLPSDDDYMRHFWLLEDGARVGTIAFAKSSLGSARTLLLSFYVFPSRRHGGVGRRAFERLKSAFAAHGRGLRLETSWTWQPAVRWYLRAGMWIRMWKRDLDFVWSAGAPAPIFEIDDVTARLVVERDGERRVVHEARRDGAVLVLEDDDERGWLGFDALPTFALGLALHGWPLIRSRELYDKYYWADAGPPEALAYKIEVWEAWDQRHGWRVQTPRIPGLTYPTWAELETKWQEA